MSLGSSTFNAHLLAGGWNEGAVRDADGPRLRPGKDQLRLYRHPLVGGVVRHARERDNPTVEEGRGQPGDGDHPAPTCSNGDDAKRTNRVRGEGIYLRSEPIV
eukprot:6532372-Pyramimonas_sp.AAC.2